MTNIIEREILIDPVLQLVQLIHLVQRVQVVLLIQLVQRVELVQLVQLVQWVQLVLLVQRKIHLIIVSCFLFIVAIMVYQFNLIFRSVYRIQLHVR